MRNRPRKRNTPPSRFSSLESRVAALEARLGGRGCPECRRLAAQLDSVKVFDEDAKEAAIRDITEVQEASWPVCPGCGRTVMAGSVPVRAFDGYADAGYAVNEPAEEMVDKLPWDDDGADDKGEW